jgi:transposase
MRRTHLRGHDNILKRLVVHTSGFNLGLWMRSLTGIGTPRACQGRAAAFTTTLIGVWRFGIVLGSTLCPSRRDRDRPGVDHATTNLYFVAA